MQKRFFWIMPGITATAKATGFSRQTLHKWRDKGCPAFLSDGTVELSILTDWLDAHCLGQRHENTYGEGLHPAAMTESRWIGGRDYGIDVGAIYATAHNFRDLLEHDGKVQAAEEFGWAWKKCAKILNEFSNRLEELGLSEPFED